MAYERKTKDIFISDEIRTILEQIESNSIVAQLLLKSRLPKDILVDDCVNYISLSSTDKGRISYLTNDRMEKMDESEYWSSTRRYHTKPGGFVGKMFKKIDSREVEKFSNQFRTIANKPSFRFEVVSGERIRELYRYNYHSSDYGTLGASCMKHEECQDFFGIYKDNPEIVSMLVMFDDNDLILGRAILWNYNSYKLMDRIYSVSDDTLPVYFKQWCSENGYYHKSEQNWYNTMAFEQFGQKKVEFQIKISLPNTNFDRYPYMDTFKFIDVNGNLYNYQPENVEFYSMINTNGYRQGSDSLRFDGISRVFRHPGECVWLGYKDMYTHHNNVKYSEVNDCHILNDDCIFREDISSYVFKDDSNNNQEAIKNQLEYMKSRKEIKKEINTTYFDSQYFDGQLTNDYIRVMMNNSNYGSITGTSQLSDTVEPNDPEVSEAVDNRESESNLNLDYSTYYTGGSEPPF